MSAKRKLFCLFLSILLTAAAFTAAAGQNITPTFDPFASGSFYVTPTPEPESGSDGNRFGKDRAEMVYILEGSFIMGTDDEDAVPDARPAHEIYLKGYWIDKYEVTNAQFSLCVKEGYCFEPRDLSSSTRSDYFTNEAYADYPVIHVDWNQASAYCKWAGKRLPTEAEWEKAARGSYGLTYPWGSTLPDELPMQVNQFGSGDTTAVDAFPEGASPWGVFNMAGNVWEWTADQYDAAYYGKSPAENPLSINGGNQYVVRGFSWAYPFSRYEITVRNAANMLIHTYDLGFRCAMDGD